MTEESDRRWDRFFTVLPCSWCASNLCSTSNSLVWGQAERSEELRCTMIKGALRSKKFPLGGGQNTSLVPVVESSGLDKIRESFETGLKIHPEESY
jgi:hypothetical protein